MTIYIGADWDQKSVVFAENVPRTLRPLRVLVPKDYLPKLL